jgi:hypothetical protein
MFPCGNNRVKISYICYNLPDIPKWIIEDQFTPVGCILDNYHIDGPGSRKISD